MRYTDRLKQDGTTSLTAGEVLNGAGGRPREPRPHHYQLAHAAIRMFALEHPLECLGMCATQENAARFIKDAYDRACEVTDGGIEPDFAADDVVVQPGLIGSYPAVVFCFPQPTRCPEAFMTALVVTVPKDELTEELAKDGLPARYFTLEAGMPGPEGQGRTVFCEWTSDTHKNMGDGPPPTLKDFTARIEQAVG